MLKKIVSGGQSGVDRAALDAAIAVCIDYGGWCPKGRRSEDGGIPERYLLQETPHADYRQRTAWNVRDSDGTLILVRNRLKGGSRYTYECAIKTERPCMIVRFDNMPAIESVMQWIIRHAIETLNIAGPRATSDVSIYTESYQFLKALLLLQGLETS
ncbi:MAG: putative molybdenum carrier protein [Chlorobium sp.]|nr:MAG: molybdenum cofactor carrier [Chlorobium sp.]